MKEEAELELQKAAMVALASKEPAGKSKNKRKVKKSVKIEDQDSAFTKQSKAKTLGLRAEPFPAKTTFAVSAKNSQIKLKTVSAVASKKNLAKENKN